MTELSTPFAPDWVSPPGESILDMAEERGWTQAELAERLGYTEKHVSQLMNGKVPVSVDAALRLERVLGSTLDFWLNLEANYQKHKARHEAERRNASWVSWLDELPIKELMAYGALPKLRNDAKHQPALVDACLRFFGVASPDEWRSHYVGMEVAFRRSRKAQSDIGAISAWLRLGEQQVEKQDGSKYDKARFEKALGAIRKLTIEPPEIFEPEIRRQLAEAGVALVLIPAIPRAHVSGVARWFGPSRPMMQLSLYGKTNDKFWFTFFHEAAHILLHANTKDERKSVFLDDPTVSHSTDPQEHEANQWAGNFLIPDSHSHILPSLRSKTSVEDFAHQIGLHPGIVVGRLQHDGYIPPDWMNNMKASFQFSDE